jgi:hypothetical protein
VKNWLSFLVLASFTPNITFESLVVTQALHIDANSSTDGGHSASPRISDERLQNGISILSQFGHLRI